jgi:hypothetical protein
MHDTAQYGGYLESIMKASTKVELEYEGKLQRAETEYEEKLRRAETEHEGKLRRAETEYHRQHAESLLSFNQSDEYVSAKTNFTLDEVQAIRNGMLVAGKVEDKGNSGSTPAAAPAAASAAAPARNAIPLGSLSDEPGNMKVQMVGSTAAASGQDDWRRNGAWCIWSPW